MTCDLETSGVECVESGPCPVRTPVSTDISTPEGFCGAWIEAFAAFIQRCGCGEIALRNWRSTNRALCEPTGFFGRAAASARSGALTYDADAAVRLLARLEQSDAPCDPYTNRALGLDSKEIYSLAGVFVGTRALGERCGYTAPQQDGVSDCREGYCGGDPLRGEASCIAFVGEGEECDGSGLARFRQGTFRLCHAVRLADPDGNYRSAFDTLRCASRAPNDTTSICVTALPDGAECSASLQCASTHCAGLTSELTSGTCAPKFHVGEPCTTHAECTSGACAMNEPRVCVEPFADGGPCADSDTACSSGYCAASAEGLHCAARPTQSPGDPCAEASDCISPFPLGWVGQYGELRAARNCQSGACVEPICGAFTTPF